MATPPASDRAFASQRRVARIITRLNIGGPSIQAAGLTTALEPFGFHTRLLHGRLGDGEGDMRTCCRPGSDAHYVEHAAPADRAVRRSPDAAAALPRTAIGAARDRAHAHGQGGTARPVGRGCLQPTRGAAPRARIVHTYHGHVLEGYFSASVNRIFITLERLLARTSDAIVAISPAIRHELVESYRHRPRPAVPRRAARLRSRAASPPSTMPTAPPPGAC